MPTFPAQELIQTLEPNSQTVTITSNQPIIDACSSAQVYVCAHADGTVTATDFPRRASWAVGQVGDRGGVSALAVSEDDNRAGAVAVAIARLIGGRTKLDLYHLGTNLSSVKPIYRPDVNHSLWPSQRVANSSAPSQPCTGHRSANSHSHHQLHTHGYHCLLLYHPPSCSSLTPHFSTASSPCAAPHRRTRSRPPPRSTTFSGSLAPPQPLQQ